MTMDIDSSNEAHSAIATSRRISRWGQAQIAAIALLLDKRRSRKALLELADHQLLDIGVTRAQADAEVAKSWF